MRLRRRHPALARAAVALAALASLAGLAAAPANASVNWVVHGRGFGHGVGMSAYGAYGYALHGKSYQFILGHYFTGTTLGTLPGPRVVRVLLDIAPGDVGFSAATSACGEALDPARSYQAHRSGNAIVLRSSGGKPLANCGRKLRAAGKGRIDISGVGTYRGALETVPTESDAGALNVVNALAVDQYVKGVIPNESPPSWPAEELKAQAVASRSFALTAGVGGNGFDLYADTRSQAYGGMDSETPLTSRAVTSTRDQVVRYHGQLAQTFYFSTSGGQTESGFLGAPEVPYLRSVRDPYDYYSPLHTWTLRYSSAEMNLRLATYVRGRLQAIRILKRGDSPRIDRALLIGSRGRSYIRGDTLQFALDAYDRWMSFRVRR